MSARDPQVFRRDSVKRLCPLLVTSGLALAALGCTTGSDVDVSTALPAAEPSASSSASRPSAAAPSAGPPAVPAPGSSRELGGLLQPAPGGDGDSWRDSAGREYRLGLVNTPETDECFGSEATRERKALTAAGFYADGYTTDTYDRSVAVVRTADGRDLNVHLARYGFADDRYLAQFRDENPALAQQLDAAFAAARSEGRGLWAACADGDQPDSPATATPVPPLSGAAPRTSGTGCHPDYVTCVQVRGDGSGHGRANDLDCGSVPGAVQLRQAGVDPYRLDGDRDGVGCDS